MLYISLPKGIVMVNRGSKLYQCPQPPEVTPLLNGHSVTVLRSLWTGQEHVKDACQYICLRTAYSCKQHFFANSKLHGILYGIMFLYMVVTLLETAGPSQWASIAVASCSKDLESSRKLIERTHPLGWSSCFQEGHPTNNQSLDSWDNQRLEDGPTPQ